MKVAILGTGMVGETLGTKLVQSGHEVMMGSRKTGNEKALAWVQKAGSKAKQGSFADAAAFGEIIFNCTLGAGALEALKMAGEKNLANRVLIDLSNPLDFSKGMPPTLFVCNSDSLGEQIQRAFPQTKVVKALNTLNCKLMVDPTMVPGDHNIFVAGNDNAAKEKVIAFLAENFGWKTKAFIDVGDITAARGTEALMLLWIRLMGKFQHGNFNWSIAK
jgi:8-hydroxy-5-deazaflavin:NADPH oxidoreductase